MRLRTTVHGILAACCLFAGIAAHDAGAHVKHHDDAPLPHLVIQCPISHAGNANDCESFVVSGNPTPRELGEATAAVPYLVIACVLIHGNAQDCVKSVTPVGGQIIASLGKGA
jgi:hypothetical protein